MATRTEPAGRGRTAPPAQRLLDAAATLFDREGIRAVGIDRLVADADVARASLYQNFGSKDALVVAYLERADERDRAGYGRAVRGLDDRPVDRVRAFFELAASAARRRDYRGCLYVNALTEFPDPRHPAHRVVGEHRRWVRDVLVAALAEAGASEPERLADRVQLLYDGALVGSKAARDAGPVTRASELVDELVAAAVSG